MNCSTDELVSERRETASVHTVKYKSTVFRNSPEEVKSTNTTRRQTGSGLI